jgi:hypothetical protein
MGEGEGACTAMLERESTRERESGGRRQLCDLGGRGVPLGCATAGRGRQKCE